MPAEDDGNSRSLPPVRLARAHAHVIAHPQTEAQQSQTTLWRSLFAWSSSQAKTSVRQ